MTELISAFAITSALLLLVERRKRQSRWHELEEPSHILDPKTYAKITRDAKKLEREATKYREIKQKKIFNKKGK